MSILTALLGSLRQRSGGGLCFAFDQTPTEQVGCDLSFLHYLCFIFFDDIKLGA